MPDEKSYLKWCLKQGRGVRLVKPSENLVRAYQQKSRNALKSMEVNAREGIYEWAVSASYYARYFAVYAGETPNTNRSRVRALFENGFSGPRPIFGYFSPMD